MVNVLQKPLLDILTLATIDQSLFRRDLGYLNTSSDAVFFTGLEARATDALPLPNVGLQATAQGGDISKRS